MEDEENLNFTRLLLTRAGSYEVVESLAKFHTSSSFDARTASRRAVRFGVHSLSSDKERTKKAD